MLGLFALFAAPSFTALRAEGQVGWVLASEETRAELTWSSVECAWQAPKKKEKGPWVGPKSLCCLGCLTLVPLVHNGHACVVSQGRVLG